MSAQLSVKMSELLASRILHDLISPVSAINNGVELVTEMGPDMLDDAMGLIRDSAKKSSYKLQMFRTAYGMGGVQESVALNFCFNDIINFFADGKIDLIWEIEEIDRHTPLPKAALKILLNCLLLLDDGLPGEVRLSMDMTEDEGNILLNVSGRCAKLQAGMIEALTQAVPEEELTPKTVQAAITRLFAEHYGFFVSVRQTSEEKVLLHIRK